jgi:hypothetical protein
MTRQSSYLQQQTTPTRVVPQRRVHRISGRRRTYLVCIDKQMRFQNRTHLVMVSFFFVV